MRPSSQGPSAPTGALVSVGGAAPPSLHGTRTALAAEYVRRAVRTATWAYRARILVHAPATEIAERVPAGMEIQPVDDISCILHVGSDTPETLAVWIGLLGRDFEVLDSPELIRHFRELAVRYTRATAPIP
jgi:hypothetical protein